MPVIYPFRAWRRPSPTPSAGLERRIWPFRAWRFTRRLPAVVLPPNLMAAILRVASADSTLAGITGGFWRGEKPADAALLESYCVFTRAGGSNSAWTSTSQWVSEKVRFRVYASDPDVDEALGEQLLASVKLWGSLDFATGYSEHTPHESSALSAPVKNRRTGDKAAWMVEANFDFRCRRGLT